MRFSSLFVGAAVVAVAGVNVYIANDVQGVKNDLTLETVELTASGSEPGGDTGGGGGGINNASTPWRFYSSDMDAWTSYYNYNSTDYKAPLDNNGNYTGTTYQGYSVSNHYEEKAKEYNYKTELGGNVIRNGKPTGNETGHWEVASSGTPGTYYDKSSKKTYKTDLFRLTCSSYGKDCYSYEEACLQRIYWDQEIK